MKYGQNKTQNCSEYYLGYKVKLDLGQLPITFPCSFSRCPCHLVRWTKFSNMQHRAQISVKPLLKIYISHYS